MGEGELWIIITRQVQIDIRCMASTQSLLRDSIPGQRLLSPLNCRRCCLPLRRTPSPPFEKWRQWAQIAQSSGTPCIVQLPHPGRMYPTGAGNRQADMPALCPSSVPVSLGDKWFDKLAIQSLLGTPKAMTLPEIAQAVEDWKRGARVAKAAGFKGIQLHGAHGFLLSQFLAHTQIEGQMHMAETPKGE